MAGKLIPIFERNDVESVDDLWLLNDADFREMGVSVGLRRKLLNALATVPLH